MSEFEAKNCQSCEGGVAPLNQAEAQRLLVAFPQWLLNGAGTEIHRIFTFSNYYETIAFVNAAAWVSHQEDHHPDLEVSYNRCVVRYSTHAIQGLSENDFICAAKLNKLIALSEKE